MHCKNYLFIHIGDGQCAYIHGESGRVNDIALLHGSNFYRNLSNHIKFGDGILCDAAWRFEGCPFVTRFTDCDHLSVYQTIFNYMLAEKRVLAENYYSRLHGLWPMLNLWSHRLDKLDIYVMALSLITNIHIVEQSPLR